VFKLNKKQKYLRRQCQRGHLSLEIACTAVFFCVFAYLTADLGYVLYGADFNDRACRDAARAAAQSMNLTEAIKKVNAVLQSHQGNALVMSGPSLYAPVVYQDFGGAPPAQTSPYVTVTTTTRINLPFAPIVFMGGATFGQTGNMSFNQSYTFPIVRLK
jgi:hypothetical protein